MYARAAAIRCDSNELTRHVFTVEEITGRMRAEEGLFRYAENVDNVHGHIEEQVGALLQQTEVLQWAKEAAEQATLAKSDL